VHLVGFIIRIYHDARSYKCQKGPIYADTYLDTAPLARPVYAEGTILPFSHSIQLLLYDIQTQGIDH